MFGWVHTTNNRCLIYILLECAPSSYNIKIVFMIRKTRINPELEVDIMIRSIFVNDEKGYYYRNIPTNLSMCNQRLVTLHVC